MRKRKLPQQSWKVQLEAVYRSDRDERIKKAYELALPEARPNPSKRIIREEKENESEYRNLCASL
jgi:hypothetical protein